MLYMLNTGKLENLGLKVTLCSKNPQAEMANLKKRKKAAMT
jgi:hypothetical protein